MHSKTIMIQGTMSNVGKSIITAGLCRLLTKWHLQVAPFKPQNMALNSAVTIDQGEIGRSQALQAFACGIPPHSDMNPVLLKPTGDRTSQVIIQGQVYANMRAEEFHHFKRQALQYVLQSHQRLVQYYDFILCEGAGSPSEINLREHDIANMGFAQSIQCPVLLVADIDRGGVFAQILGTLQILEQNEVNLIKGIIINGFRGDIKLLQPGLEWLRRQTSIPVLGVLPHIPQLNLDAEDSLSLPSDSISKEKVNIVVVKLPRMSNATDFQALTLDPHINVKFSESYQACDVVIIPGSKSVLADLQWMKQGHWAHQLNKHLRYGGKLIGICGGYQMLGKQIQDPHNFEAGGIEELDGFGFLDINTAIHENKQLRNVQGQLTLDSSPFTGYEIHMGESYGEDLKHPLLTINNQPHGVLRDNILGCYVHGLFDQAEARQSLLNWMGVSSHPQEDLTSKREQSLDILCQHIQDHLDMDTIRLLVKNASATLSESDWGLLEPVM